jgi:hypothetical protein
MGLTDAERAEIRRVLREARPKPRPPLQPVPPAPVKAQQIWDKNRRQTIAQNAATSAEAFAKVVEEDSYEARRRKAITKEMAQWVRDSQDPRVRYQRELNRFMEAKRTIEDAVEDEYVYVGGFRERRYKTTCHRGKGDPDYGL